MCARRRQLSVVSISELASPFIVLEFFVNSKTAEQKLSTKKIKTSRVVPCSSEERCLENVSVRVVLCAPFSSKK